MFWSHFVDVNVLVMDMSVLVTLCINVLVTLSGCERSGHTL